MTNRDIPVLWALQRYKADVEAIEGKRSWLYDRMYSVTKALTGMPHSGNGSGFDEILAKLSDTDLRYEEVLRMYLRKQAEADRIIKSIASESMRSFVRMMYVDHQSKPEVMEAMRLTEWGFRQAREAVENAPCMAAVRWREKYMADNAGGESDGE